MPWVGLKMVPSATSPVTNGQPIDPPVRNCRDPAAEKPLEPAPISFSSPAHRKMTPTTMRNAATASWWDRSTRIIVWCLHIRAVRSAVLPYAPGDGYT
jgi:hypothetical protein